MNDSRLDPPQSASIQQVHEHEGQPVESEVDSYEVEQQRVNDDEGLTSPDSADKGRTVGAETAIQSEGEAKVDESSKTNVVDPPTSDNNNDEQPLPVPLKDALPPPPEHDQPPSIKLKPRRPRPPKHGILKPPSTSPAHSARFSFRRDILQPLQYSRLAGGVVPVSSGLPSTVAVGEAMGNAAVSAGSWMGSAFKRLGQAAGVVVEGQQGQPQGSVPASLTARATPITSATPSTIPSENPAPSASNPSQPSQAPLPPPPAPPPPPSLSVSEMKQVRFRMQSLAVVYPINGASSSSFASSSDSTSPSSTSRSAPRSHTTFFNDLKVGFHPGPPLAPVEEAETRKRVDREWRSRIRMRSRTSDDKVNGGGEKGKEKSKGETKGWTGAELERLYRECCRTREEPGIERIKRMLRENPTNPPKVIDLSRELLSHGAVEALSDLLSVDFGLKKLVLDGCGLDDESVKPLLHALLVSGCVPTVSLAGNKRIRQKGWKYIAIFVKKAKFLRYLDLSENNIDRKAAEWLVQSIVPTPPDTSSSATDSTSPLITFDSPKPTNGGNAQNGKESASEGGGLEEAEEEEDQRELEPLFEVAPLLKETKDEPAGTVLSLRLENCGLRGQGLEVLAQGVRISSLKHVSLRRNRINAASTVFLAVMIRDFPLATEMSPPPKSLQDASSPPNGLLDSPPTPRHAAPFEGGNSVSARQGFSRSTSTLSTSNEGTNGHAEERSNNVATETQREVWQANELRKRLRKQIEDLPRIGSLLTLDVKGNDIRGGVTYIAQVLKRNRTLKVLNLSENKIDMLGLVAIAEALRFNTTLETLDMSYNPCCGPSIEGMLTLRSSMMITPALKRLFLNSTDLTSAGAIALAEFLPEAQSLLHLDLTSNQIDISGVLALAVSVKLNSTIRCLDINIPPNDPDFSRLSQDILETCVRNTEIAQAEADGKGRKVTIAQPIKNSTLAVNLEERQRAEELEEQRRKKARQEGKSIFAAAEETRDVVKELLEVDDQARSKGVIVAPSEVVRDALVQLQLAEAQLAEAFTATRQGDQRERAEMLLMELASLLDFARELYDRPATSSQPSRSPLLVDSNGKDRSGSTPSTLQIPGSPAHPDDQPSSPSFSLTSSDSEDSDVEEDSTITIETSSSTTGPKPPSLPALDTSQSPHSSPLSSPTSRRSPIESSSRSMTLEEGEIFRKGLALGATQVPDDDDEDSATGIESSKGEDGKGLGLGLGLGDVSGDQLKNEILEAKVPRSPRTSFSGSSAPPQSPPTSSASSADLSDSAIDEE